MSEHLGLSESDADARWIGIRRHQAILIIAGLGLVGEGVIAHHHALLEVVVGVAVLLGAVPAFDGRTASVLGATTVRYFWRSRWHIIAIRSAGAALHVSARGEADVVGYELNHRGRMDLSGTDTELSDRLAAMAVGLRARTASSHFSLHVEARGDETFTLLATDPYVSRQEGWTLNQDLLRELMGVDKASLTSGFLERWSYIRTTTGLVRVLRIRDFNASGDTTAVLERLLMAASRPGLALHCNVLTANKAQRVASRAVHRVGSDGEVTSAAGFRRTAKATRALRRLAQREEVVASGQALLQVGAYVRVRAASIGDLRRDVSDVVTSCHESGLRVERGVGMQALWYCFQIPGGAGW